MFRLQALACLLALLPSASSAAGGCVVLDADDNDVTNSVYDFGSETVMCEGEKACKGFKGSNCPNVQCKGLETCLDAYFMGVTGKVECFEKHACHRTEFHAAIDPSTSRAKQQVNVDCIGNGACDVTKMTNMHYVRCNGSESCRQAKITADSVECADGGDYYKACSDDIAVVAKNCLVCGHQGCGHAINQCKYRISDEEVTIDYWDTHWQADEWTKCDASQKWTGTHCFKFEKHYTDPDWEDTHAAFNEGAQGGVEYGATLDPESDGYQEAYMEKVKPHHFGAFLMVAALGSFGYWYWKRSGSPPLAKMFGSKSSAGPVGGRTPVGSGFGNDKFYDEEYEENLAPSDGEVI